MRFPDRQKIHILYLVVDIILIISIFSLVCKLNFSRIPQNFLQMKPYFFVFYIWATTLIFLLYNNNLYATDRALSIPAEWWKVNSCVFYSSILTGFFIFGFKINIFSRFVFLEVFFLLAVILSSWRTIKRIWLRNLIKKGFANQNILIIGAGKIGQLLAEEIQYNHYLGLKIVGFLDDYKTEVKNGYKILGKTKDLEEVVKKYFIDEIYISIPSERNLTSVLLKEGIRLKKSVRIVAEQFDCLPKKIGLNYIGYIPLISYYEKPRHGSEGIIKRLFDIIISAALLILLSPLFLIIAFLIKLESKGPVFYISKRCGKKGRTFSFYKFRSMIHNADSYKNDLLSKSETKGPIFKMKNDPRVTKIGRFLRKYSLDELPQLINVLKGDMSLVGPRPFPIDETNKIAYNHLVRLEIKPGITGLAQIKGRSDLSFNQWAKWDLWYLSHWSLGLDIKILWLTIPAIWKAKGAY